MASKNYTYYLPIPLVEELRELAKKEQRALNNLISKILTDYVKENKK